MTTLDLRARLWRSKLDRDLARGMRPDATPALALRARQLCDPDERQRLAAELDALVELATDDGPPEPGIAAQLRAVREQHAIIRRLAVRLRDHRAVSPCGVARAHRLVVDRVSPLYHGADALAIRAAARQVLDELPA
jgi:hypothetical protein